MKKIHDVVYDKPYDIVPKDWIEAFLKKIVIHKKLVDFGVQLGWIYLYTGGNFK